MALCINGKVDEALYVIAVVCSTWSAVNLATSQRDLLTPLGDTSLPGVHAANRMVSRLGVPKHGFVLQFKCFNYQGKGFNLLS